MLMDTFQIHHVKVVLKDLLESYLATSSEAGNRPGHFLVVRWLANDVHHYWMVRIDDESEGTWLRATDEKERNLKFHCEFTW